MSRLTNLLLVVLLSLSSLSAQAQPKEGAAAQMPPRHFTLGTFGDDVTLKFDCDGQDSAREVICDATAIRVRRMTDEQRVKAKAELAQFDTASEVDIEKARKAFAGFDLEKLRSRRAQATPAQAAYYTEFLFATQAVQAATDRQSLKVAIGRMNELEENSCRISVERLGQSTFKRVSSNRWISNPGPQGLCNVVTVQVLENSDAYQLLWKLTQTTVSADTDRPLCKFLKNSLNKAQVYSWDYPNTTAPGCKYLTVE